MDLRRNDFLPVYKLSVGHGLPVAFENHDWLLSVAEIIVVDTVVWKHKKKMSKKLKTDQRMLKQTC